MFYKRRRTPKPTFLSMSQSWVSTISGSPVSSACIFDPSDLKHPRRAPLPPDAKRDDSIFRIDSESGSFYMKMGGLIFAIGSMIYTCLEIGVYVENRSCLNIVMGIEPCIFIIYIMLQLYFIFHSSQVWWKKGFVFSGGGNMVCTAGPYFNVSANILVWNDASGGHWL